MAEEFDIDNVIPKEEQQNEIVDKLERDNSLGSFDLSLNYDIESKKASSRGNIARSTMDGNGFKLDVSQNNNAVKVDNVSEGLISSDSDFEAAAAAAGHQNFNEQRAQEFSQQKNSEEIKRDVSKTFKKMLTANQRRTNASSQMRANIDDLGNGNDSTKYEGSRYEQDQDT